MRVKHGAYVALIAAFLAGPVTLAAPQQAPQQSPQRVVSTFLCTDEYVFRLLPRERIAALSFLSADDNPVVSTIHDQVKGIPLIRGSAEEVLSLHPDLVVMYRGTNPKLKAHLIEAHIPFLEVDWANSIADIRKVARTLGEALGERGRAEALITEMDRKIAAAHKFAPRVPVRALIYEPNGYANSGGVTEDVLRVAGLQDVSGGMTQTRQGTIPVEEVIAQPPALLILNGEHEKAPSRGDLVLKHPALRALPANTVIAHTSLTPLLCPGPWSADVAKPLAELARKASLASPPARP
jgi:iron complex transport system substrate-binding protein